MKLYFCLLVTLVFQACTKDVQSPSTIDVVHLAGIVANPSGKTVASYWKDGVYARLTKTDSASEVDCMAVSGSNVWIGGWDWSLLPNTAVVWKNGEQVSFNCPGEIYATAAQGSDLYETHFDNTNRCWVYSKNGVATAIADTALSIQPTGIALQGNDVFISGGSLVSSGTHSVQHAEYWKNGMLLFRDARDTRALGLAVDKTHVYLCGFFIDQADSSLKACYWKDDELIALKTEGLYSIAFSIFVNEDVYVAGYDGQKAVYWKNGIPTALTDGATPASANSIAVKGSDVHIGGHENYYPVYWKNGEKQTIDNQNTKGQIKVVVVQ